MKTTERLTKKELSTIWRKFYLSYGACGGYDVLSGPNFMWGLTPLYDKYYENDEKCDRLLKHYKFFNVENIFGSIIYGIVTAMEEQKALNKDINDEMIETTKVSLMGPMSGIGDALNPGLLVPLLLSISIEFSKSGNLFGALFYIVVYNVLMIIVSKTLFNSGYKLGMDALKNLMSKSASNLRDSLLLMGVTIMGGITASYVNFNLAVKIPSGNDKILLQDVLDGILPHLLPLLLVLACWQIMARKNVSMVKMIVILFILTFALAFVGVV